ncbi:MAG TPA: type II toxin-antitoxin system CcdA family antitoxin [Burkholderiaceae bacterium]|nr:type II toxin-antitoxin system CcdA family antitoxin [Burkholderiaceae bacterium]
MTSPKPNPDVDRTLPLRRSRGSVSLRKSTNITLRLELVEEAKALGINLSKAAEAGVADAVARKRAERWLADNRDALESSNAFVERNGLPLARYRNF